jgi:hypothetical protein
MNLLVKVLESMADRPAVGSKRRRLEAKDDLIPSVKRQEVVEQTLATRLTQYVERIDTDLVRTSFEGLAVFGLLNKWSRNMIYSTRKTMPLTSVQPDMLIKRCRQEVFTGCI